MQTESLPIMVHGMVLGEITANWVDFASIDESYASADDVTSCEENNTVMPENMSICKFVDVENTYLFDGRNNR